MGLALNSLLGTLVAVCPAQAWGNLALLGSHCRGREPQQVQRALGPCQELPVLPEGLENRLGSQEAVCSGKHEPLPQQAQPAHRSSVP